MPMPAHIQKQLIIKRLKGKEGKQRIDEINRILEEMPGYNSGPYGELKEWLGNQLGLTRTRKKERARAFFAVKREAIRQFALVGFPSVGKSSLLKALSSAQIKIGSYDFTTVKPQSVIVKIKGVEIQLVDLPGIISDASEDKGKGIRVLSVAKNSDGIIIMHDLSKPATQLEQVFSELKEFGLLNKIVFIVANKADLPDTKKNFQELRTVFADIDIIPASVSFEKNLELVKEKIWEKSNLIRIFTKSNGIVSEKPLALFKGATVKDLAEKIHKDFLKRFKYAQVAGSSVRFSGQRCGLEHVLHDEDVVELFLSP